jgi:hypothetical protein
VAAGQDADAERELHAVLDQNRDWDMNADLAWSALHELALAYEAQGDFAQAFTAARQAWDAAQRTSGTALSGHILHAIAARDLASAAARWSGATAADRDQVRKSLDQWCTGLDPRHGTLAGALIAAPPGPAEVAALRQLLAH